MELNHITTTEKVYWSFWSVYIYIYIYVIHFTEPEISNLKEARWVQYLCSHQNNVPPQLSTQWLCGNSCTRTYDTCTLCTAVHHVPKCISCHKAIVVITGRAHCFHECIYIMPIFLLWDLNTQCSVCHASLMTTYDLLCMYSLLLIFCMLVKKEPIYNRFE